MVKLQTFRREFENLNMKSEETIKIIFLEFLFLLNRLEAMVKKYPKEKLLGRY